VSPLVWNKLTHLKAHYFRLVNQLTSAHSRSMFEFVLIQSLEPPHLQPQLHELLRRFLSNCDAQGRNRGGLVLGQDQSEERDACAVRA